MLMNSFTYRNGEFVLENPGPLQLDARCTAVCGPVGSGKSTLFKLLADPELRPVGAFSGTPFLSYLSQDLTRLFSGNTPESLIRLYSAPGTQIGRHFQISRFRELCNIFEFPLATERTRRLHSFSEGELQRLALSLALAVDSELLLLDEPLTALNARFRDVFYTLIAKEKTRRQFLLISHSARDISRTSDQFIWVHEGRITQGGDVKLLLEKKEYLQYLRP